MQGAVTGRGNRVVLVFAFLDLVSSYRNRNGVTQQPFRYAAVTVGFFLLFFIETRLKLSIFIVLPRFTCINPIAGIYRKASLQTNSAKISNLMAMSSHCFMFQWG